MTWTGTTPLSAPSIFIDGDTETTGSSVVHFGRMTKELTLRRVLVNMGSDRFAVDDILFYKGKALDDLSLKIKQNRPWQSHLDKHP